MLKAQKTARTEKLGICALRFVNRETRALQGAGLPRWPKAGMPFVDPRISTFRLDPALNTIHLCSIKPLSPKQTRLLHFLEQRGIGGLPPPTTREICARFGYESTRAAVDLLNILVRKGHIVRDPGLARGIRLVHPPSGVPVLGSVPAGHPREAQAEIIDTLRINPEEYGIRDRSAAFLLKVDGDSMSGRSLIEGDLVLLEHGATPRNGEIVAALIDNESTLKTLVLRDRKAWLRAENPRYRDLTPAWDLQIQGVARAVFRRLSS